MRYFVLLVYLLFTALFVKVQAQTVIDFVANPTATGPNTWDPTYWARGGCGGSQKWGPNPLPVNGYNIRLVGASYIYPLPPARALYLYAARNGVDPQVETHQDYNAILSLEYPFKANKSYLIEFTGIKDENWWSAGTTRPARYKKAVFWVKLDDSPVINTPSQNPCGYDLHPVEKSVGRYSKLIADPRMVLEDTTYKVKFSLIENKSALKIIFDPSPADPNLSFASQFGLRRIKITEIPYEEDGPSYTASYTNVPRPRPWNPVYEIPGVVVRPTDGHAIPTKRGTLNVSTNQWISNGENLGYSVYLSEITQNDYVSEVISMSVKGDLVQDPRGGRPSQALIPLPGAYQNNNYTYQVVNGDILITVTNSTNTPPIASVDFDFVYN